MQVSWKEPQGLQWGGDGCKLLPPPCSWDTSGIPDTGLGITLHALALQYGFIPMPGRSACKWLFYKMNCKKNDLSAGVLVAALKQCIASLRLSPQFMLAGR